MDAINDRMDLTHLYTVIAPSDANFLATQGLLNNDHVPFWLSGVKTLSLSDTPHDRGHRAHTESDILSSIDREFLADNVRLVAAAVAHFAEVVP